MRTAFYMGPPTPGKEMEGDLSRIHPELSRGSKV
jgi:hypothetical protein